MPRPLLLIGLILFLVAYSAPGAWALVDLFRRDPQVYVEAGDSRDNWAIAVVFSYVLLGVVGVGGVEQDEWVDPLAYDQ
jgi:hypothetical protein